MSHIELLLKNKLHAELRQKIEQQIGEALPKMGELYLSVSIADSQFNPYHTPSNSTSFSEIEGYNYDSPVPCSHLVLNEKLGFPSVPPKENQKKFWRDYHLDMMETAHDIKEEFAKYGCKTGLFEHYLREKDKTYRFGQLVMFVPNIKPEQLPNGQILSQTNLDQLGLFVVLLAQKGWLDLERDRQAIKEAYGAPVLGWVQRYMNRHQGLDAPPVSPT